MSNWLVLRCYAAVLALLFPLFANAQGLAVPPLSSRPGSDYSLYLNFAGFNFNGPWGTFDQPTYFPTPTPAYSLDGDTANFSTAEIANIRVMHARAAEKYSIFNLNVTTVDPAPLASTDAQRQVFYDNQPRFMHTVVGGNGAWMGGGAGISYLNVFTPSFPVDGRGRKTNFTFPALVASNLQYISEVIAHENGHALNINHQSRGTGSGYVEYTFGTGTGPGSRAPFMGNSTSAERGLWVVGDVRTSTGTNPAVYQSQNEIQRVFAFNPQLTFAHDGIGRTLATATPLPRLGTLIDSSLARGIIVPTSDTNPNPIGASNYITGYFQFTTTGGMNTINLLSGRSSLVPGIADPGAMLDGTLELLNSNGTVLFTSNSGVLTETISQFLTPGDYYIRISSAGGFTSNQNIGGVNHTTQYFDMGSYFLTGTIAVAVPEPSSIAMLSMVLAAAGLQWQLKAKAHKRASMYTIQGN